MNKLHTLVYSKSDGEPLYIVLLLFESRSQFPSAVYCSLTGPYFQ